MATIADCILLFNTCPDEAVADKIASLLVEQRHAACVNIMPNVRSVYRWKGKLERDQECLLLIKSTQAHLQAIKSIIVDNHPYELPEIVAVPINAGLDDYLSWIHECVES